MDAADVMTVDAAGLPVDVVTVDVLARLQLTARRAGREIRLTGASPELMELIRLCGLESVLCPRGP